MTYRVSFKPEAMADLNEIFEVIADTAEETIGTKRLHGELVEP